MATLAETITVPVLKDYLGNEKPTDDDDFYQGAIDAAIETWQDETQREWVTVTDATTTTPRSFVPGSSPVLRIHDCTVVTSVVDDGTTLAVSAYQPEPVGVARTGQARPYEQIRLLGGYWTPSPYGEATVVVTAKWGWPAFPARAIEAVKIIAKDIVLNRDVRLGVIAVTEAAGVSARTNTVVRAAVQHYAAIETWGIA